MHGIPDRMEYAVSVAARLSPQARATRSRCRQARFDQGRLDWNELRRQRRDQHGYRRRPRARSHRSRPTVPAPVTFRGTPAPRFWELEDARIDYGLMPVGPTDLAQLLLIEYAERLWQRLVRDTAHAAGRIADARSSSLVVTDSFGVKRLLRPIGDPALPRPRTGRCGSMAYRRRAGTGADREPRNQSLLPAAHHRAAARRAVGRGRALHARRDGQPRVGESSARSRARSSKRCSASSATQTPAEPPIACERAAALSPVIDRARALDPVCCRSKPPVRTAGSSRG